MAASPRFKVYDSAGQYQAACKEIEAAASLVAFYGDGATIRDGHASILWIEGRNGWAGESFDRVAQLITNELGE